jgi:predicted nucleic acid-binding protein
MASIVIQDACVLINLLASGRFEDIAGGCGLRFAVASVVSQEAMYLRNDEAGELMLIDLKPLIKKRLLETLTAQSDHEKLRYIELASKLDDGEAESIAIAEARHFALATDDRKARNLIQSEGLKIELWSTCSLLKLWQTKCAISNNDLRGVLITIYQRAKYRPKPGHPDHEWWVKMSSK